MIIPLILKPKLRSLLNRWLRSKRSKSQHFRDVFLIAFGFAVMYSIYAGTCQALFKIQQVVNIAYVAPAIPLGLVFLLLSGLLFFSNCVAALGALFFSNDLEIIFAAPIKPFTIFWSEFIEILLASSWMAIIFGLPVVLGFGVSYNANWYYFPIALLILTPYFVIPAALSIIVVTILAQIIPANRTRELMIVACALMLLGLYFGVKLLLDTGGGFKDTADLLRIVNLLSMPNREWLPSHWTSIALSEFLIPTGRPILPYAMMLGAVSIFLSSLAFIAVRLMHYRAYSRARSTGHGWRINSKASHLRVIAATPFLKPLTRALLMKEFRVFARDMGQAVQLLLLLGLCLIYLYNSRVLNSADGLPPNIRAWWQGFLIISNLAMGAFVITAVGTRFVFPSLSLEGQSWWIVQSSPVSFKELLHTKFWIWYTPVSIISAVVFIAGAFAINAEPKILFLNIVSSLVICYGIVGLGVGLGAFFANFTWEHASQLAASFGSLVYMMSSVVLIAFNLLPTSILIMIQAMNTGRVALSEPQWWIASICSLALVWYMNISATRFALKLGENALRDRMN